MKSIRTRYDNNVFETRQLSNGIPVYLQKPALVPDERGVLVAFLPRVGSWLDREGEYGLAHFFEHVPFDTRRLKKVDAWGGSWNGSTASRYTEFHLIASRNRFGAVAQLLASMLADPPIVEKVIRRERGVIAREWHQKNADWRYIALLHYMQEFWGAAHPLGHLPLGNLEVIESMQAAAVADFYSRYYHAGNIRLLCGGSFAELDEESILLALEKNFGSIRGGPAANVEISVPQRQGQHVRVSDARYQGEGMKISFFGHQTLDDFDVDALDLLRSMLSGMQSPLARELRTKRGWVYSTNLCDFHRFGNFWEFLFRCNTNHEGYPEIRGIFFDVLRGLTSRDVMQKQRMRQQARRGSWCHPVARCESAIVTLSECGRIKSWHQWEEIEDRQTADRVLAWRDSLLAQNPYVFELLLK